jgi:hypothetical protein
MSAAGDGGYTYVYIYIHVCDCVYIYIYIHVTHVPLLVVHLHRYVAPICVTRGLCVLELLRNLRRLVQSTLLQLHTHVDTLTTDRAHTQSPHCTRKIHTSERWRSVSSLMIGLAADGDPEEPPLSSCTTIVYVCEGV